MKPHSKSLFAMAAAVGLAVFGHGSALATIIAIDDFNAYSPAMTLIGGTGGTGWGANAWMLTGTSSTATVNDYSGNNKVDIALSGTATTVAAGRRLDSGLTGTFYVGYAIAYTGTGVFSENNTFGLVVSPLEVPSATVGGNVFNFGLRSSGSASEASSTNHFSVRASTAGASVTNYNQATGGLVVPNTEYFLIAKLTYSGSSTYDQIDLWLNPPATETAPHATLALAAGAGIGTVNSVYLRQAANQTTDAWRVNNLILATTFGEVVSIVPEPTSAVLVGLGLAALWMSRRRKN